MGRLLVHMHHGGDDRFFGLVLLQEAERFFKIPPDLRQLLILKEVRRGSEQHLHHPDAVLPGAAARRLDLAFRLGPVTLGRLNEVEVLLAAGEVNVGVAGVFLFPALVVGLDVGDLWPLVFGKAHNGVLQLAQGQPSFLIVESG